MVVEWFGLQFLRLESMEGGDVIYKTRTISTFDLRPAQVGTAQALDHHVQLIFELDNGDGRSRKKSGSETHRAHHRWLTAYGSS
jgi:hypothetical protein